MGLVAAVGTAVAAVAADVGVAVTATALTVGFETIAAVGAGLGVIGAVTGDKALTYVGLGLGVVGGIGAFAASAGVLGADATSGIGGAANPLAPTAADAAAGSTSGDVVNSLAGTSSANLVNSNFSPDLVDQAASGPASAAYSAGPPSGDVLVGDSNATDATRAGFNDPGAQVSAPPATGTSGFNDPGATGQAAPPASTAAPASNTSIPPFQPQGADTGVAPSGGVDSTSIAGINGPGTSGSPEALVGGSGDSDGIFGNLVNFAKTNGGGLVGLGVLQAGGSLISGWTSSLTPAQVALANAQAANNQAQANLTTQQTQNLAQPRSVATLAPVTGQPGQPIIAAPTAGLINGAPPVAGVTGAPAVPA